MARRAAKLIHRIMLTFSKTKNGFAFSLGEVGSLADLHATQNAILEVSEIILCDTHLAVQPESSQVLFYLLKILRATQPDEFQLEALAEAEAVKNRLALGPLEFSQRMAEAFGPTQKPAQKNVTVKVDQLLTSEDVAKIFENMKTKNAPPAPAAEPQKPTVWGGPEMLEKAAATVGDLAALEI